MHNVSVNGGHIDFSPKVASGSWWQDVCSPCIADMPPHRVYLARRISHLLY